MEKVRHNLSPDLECGFISFQAAEETLTEAVVALGKPLSPEAANVLAATYASLWILIERERKDVTRFQINLGDAKAEIHLKRDPMGDHPVYFIDDDNLVACWERNGQRNAKTYEKTSALLARSYGCADISDHIIMAAKHDAETLRRVLREVS